MIKLIATDLDGTLFRDDKSFSEELYDLFKKMQSLDIKFVIATGNQYELVQQRFEQIKDDLVYLVENGCKLVYKNQLIYKNTLSKEHAIKIHQLLKKYDVMIVVCTDHGAYIPSSYKHQEEFLRKFYRNYQYISDVSEITEDILKFSIADFNGQPVKIADELRKELDDLQIVTTGNVWFDIFNQGMNKGVGLRELQKFFNVTYEETAAFGDMHNDIALLENAGESYAMANGCDEAKKVAKYITLSNNEDGVIVEIKKILKNYNM